MDLLKWYGDVLSMNVTSAIYPLLVAFRVIWWLCLVFAAMDLHVLPGSVFIRALLIAPLTVSYLIVGLGLLIVLTKWE